MMSMARTMLDDPCKAGYLPCYLADEESRQIRIGSEGRIFHDLLLPEGWLTSVMLFSVSSMQVSYLELLCYAILDMATPMALGECLSCWRYRYTALYS